MLKTAPILGCGFFLVDYVVIGFKSSNIIISYILFFNDPTLQIDKRLVESILIE